MKLARVIFLFTAIAFVAIFSHAQERQFKAGEGIRDISPTNFPVLVNAMFTERVATNVVDRLNARALVLDDGETKIALTVVDSCMVPRELLDLAKAIAHDVTGIPTDKMMISATHTHSAPSAMGCLGSRADSNYVAFLPGRIAEAIIQANGRMVPAKIGWAVVDDWKHTFNRRWIRRPDKMLTDPFGQQNVRAHMHPGHESPDVVGPSGPVDPALSIIALQTVEGRPLAMFANYSQHYYDSPLLSSDYYGRFANHVTAMLNGTNAAPFLAMMSQGTSGDQMWMDYGASRKEIGYDAYARELAEEAVAAYRGIKFTNYVSLAMEQATLKLNYRTPTEDRLEWARKTAASLGARLPQTLPEVYALEAIYIHERPVTELVLQAIRIGDVGIAAIPNEVYAISGFKIKGRSPLQTTINVELANGSEGYIPPPEQHQLGGYTTWPARTAGLEELAEPKIVDELIDLLEEVADKGQRQIVASDGVYSKTVLASKPAAYWRLDDLQYYPVAADSSTNGHPAKFEDGVALYLPGVGSGSGISPNPELKPSNFSGSNEVNRAVHFAGGRIRADVPKLPKTYSVEMWFWNGLPNNARDVTGYLFSRGKDGDTEANGDHLGIAGTHSPGNEGRLIVFNGNKANEVLVGRTVLQPKTWHDVAMVRDADKVTVYLDGKSEPEIAGKLGATFPADSDQLFLGGRNDRFSGLEGKLDEVAVYDRALTPEEVGAHFKAGGVKIESQAAAPRKHASDPLSPQESLKKIHISPGYRAELVASEPLVLDPVAIDWDTSGRLWALEMADYPLGLDGKGKPGGRVRVLEDTDGDGIYDKSHLFADGLSFPTGLITWRDGVIVTAAPEIIFLRDTDGDGKADVRQVLFSGFLEGNQQLRINGLRWGLDNWIFCAVGGHYRGYGAATKIKSHLTGEEIALGSRDFRFRPNTGEFEPESGPSQFGRNRDDWGHWFGTQNSHPLWNYVLSDRYIRRNPHVAAPDPTVQVMVPDNPKVFPLSRPEKRYHSFDQAGHFTSGCSGTIYRDNLLFPATEMHAFACEPFHNLVHHEILSDNGVSFSAHRTPAEQTSEFFASEDSWTRPVMIRTGPDGALWVVDMYRYMIEHPDWLPAEGKEELLPFYREGDDKGRIYRVVPTQALQHKIISLEKLPTAYLVKALDSSNEWQRDKAQQLLLWRADKTAIQPLKDLAQQSSNSLARLHAICTLEGLNALTPELLESALKDQNPGLRENALRLAEARYTPAIMKAASSLANDPSAKVRLQLACTLGEWKSREAGQTLAKLAVNDHSSPFTVAAIMSSALPHLETLVAGVNQRHALQVFSEPLFTTALGLNRRDLVAELLKPIFEQNEFGRYTAFLRLLDRRKSSVEELIKAAPDDLLSKQLVNAKALFLEAKRVVAGSGNQRFDAFALLTHDPANREGAMSQLAKEIKPSAAIEMQRAAIAAIAETGASNVPEFLLSDWSNHAPDSRAAILEALMRREAWAYDLLKSIERGAVSTSDLNAARRNRLLKNDSSRIRELATKVFNQPANSNRAKIVEDFRPAMQLTGNTAHGKEIFGKLCVTCHQREGIGNQVGPDLQSVIEHPSEKLLVNILDPNADVQPGFNAYSCGLANGEELYGLISAETATSVVFKFADGVSRTINRKEINTLRSSNLSLMPEGLEQGLSKQDVADLIAYVKSR
jgi:putative membrane-bound dehydrogenase-like protein